MPSLIVAIFVPLSGVLSPMKLNGKWARFRLIFVACATVDVCTEIETISARGTLWNLWNFSIT